MFEHCIHVNRKAVPPKANQSLNRYQQNGSRDVWFLWPLANALRLNGARSTVHPCCTVLGTCNSLCSMLFSGSVAGRACDCSVSFEKFSCHKGWLSGNPESTEIPNRPVKKKMGPIQEKSWKLGWFRILQNGEKMVRDSWLFVKKVENRLFFNKVLIGGGKLDKISMN